MKKWSKFDSAEDRIHRHVIINSITDCWEWVGAKLKGGYGNLSFRGTYYQAHRFSYITFIKEIPVGMLVCHTCDNPSCVNPKHLFVGTYSDNKQDQLSKGVLGCSYGEKNGKSKLHKEDVLEIRRLWKNKGSVRITKVMLGKMFGISDTHVGYIIRNKTWSIDNECCVCERSRC